MRAVYGILDLMVRPAVVLAVLVAAAADAHATCRVLEVDFTPSRDLQLAIWLEDAAGNYVDTFYVTEDIATHGLGNRPGRMDLNSELRWPYGRRESSLPVWAHHRGETYPRIVFQDANEDGITHEAAKSSREPRYCMPYLIGSPDWNVAADAGTCASAQGTGPMSDKGRFTNDGGVSYYPPRSDISMTPDYDSADVALFAALNDLDAVSQATPPPGQPVALHVALPADLPDGAYVLWIEANREYDQNASWSFPSPVGLVYGDYGRAYRGQPSIVWTTPVTLDGAGHTSVSLDYAGYGDPDGASGDVSGPDATITSDVEGSGAGRLLVASAPEGMYRLRAVTTIGDDTVPPEAPGQLHATDVTATAATLAFTAPSDQIGHTGGGPGGAATGYEIRWRAGMALSAANFVSEGARLTTAPTPEAPGVTQVIDLPALTPNTHYWVAIRALDGCLNQSPLAVVDFVTPRAAAGQVDACFVATAAYGSPLAADVSFLRRFRDQALRSQAAGELFVEAYYTFGPAFADAIAPSDTLRALTRSALAPAVDLAHIVTD